MTGYKPRGIKVSPRSRKAIQGEAQSLRERFLHGDSRFIDVIEVLETLQHSDKLDFEITDDINDDAITYPSEKFMQIRTEVYEGACDDIGHYRFTIAHEIGHFYLHNSERGTGFGRNGVELPEAAYEDSEWQADEYASELLIDSRDLTGNETAKEISQIYGTSPAAAECKLDKMKNS